MATSTTTTNFNLGSKVAIKNREYTVIDRKVTADAYPNTKKNCPHIELHIILEGKRGGLKSGFVTTSGAIVLF